MNSFEYLERMKKIQISLLDFLDNDDNIEANYQNLNELFEDIKIHDSPDKFKPLLHLILKISITLIIFKNPKKNIKDF